MKSKHRIDSNQSFDEEYLKFIQATLSEWQSSEDSVAYADIQVDAEKHPSVILSKCCIRR